MSPDTKLRIPKVKKLVKKTIFRNPLWGPPGPPPRPQARPIDPGGFWGGYTTYLHRFRSNFDTYTTWDDPAHRHASR